MKAVATPPGYEPAAESVAFAERETAVRHRELRLTHDPADAVKGADAVYTDVWLSMGNPAEQRERRLAELGPFQMDGALMDRARPEAVFLHCLPAHRGEEVTAEVIDGPRSVVFEQAGNRLPATQAVLYALLTGRRGGAR